MPYRITVRGIVQGVGFRPFVYRLARSMGLKGYVKNTGTGCVEIVVDRNVKEFVERLRKEKPPIARIDDVVVEEVDEKLADFQIVKSGGKKGQLSLPPPDVAVCKLCLEEVFDRKNRRYMYPFTSCTDCGPRFSVALRLPYDRENTTFADFPLCDECMKEYENVNDRRYYAQSIACPKCGPAYSLFYRTQKVEGLKAIEKTAELIDDGRVVAIKGIGGYHIACRADDEEVVKKLRERLNRPQQPFAVMVRNAETAEEVACLSDREREELESYVRPIVVLKAKGKLASAIAPGLNTLGLMLPYTPLHSILFSFLECSAIVMTSANMPGEPMFTDESILESGLADAYLTHNLKIANRIDDSVVKFVGGKRTIIRKSRGFIPDRIGVETDVKAVAVGAELYNSIALLRDRSIIQSQYIGNTSNFRTYSEFFEKAFKFWLDFTQLKPEYVFCDLHPLYNTSRFAERYAEESGVELIRVQHHFAHAMSVMAERKLNSAVAIAVDGAGYGFDGNTWGCEVLWLDFENLEFERLMRMEYLLLPGGDAATKKPGRILFSIVPDAKLDWKTMDVNPELVEVQIKKRINVAKASSAGRYLDACSALLGLCYERTYEGEAAMKLEALASYGNREVAEKWLEECPPEYSEVVEKSKYSLPFKTRIDRSGKTGKAGKLRVLEVKNPILKAIEERGKRADKALFLTLYLARGIAEVAVEEALKRDSCIVMSGGVAYSSIVTPEVERVAEGVEFYVNELTAAGDNGISVGQLYSSLLLG